MSDIPKKKRARRKERGEHYINNKEFSEAIVEYTRGIKEDKAAGKEPRMMSDYIATSFMKIAQGLSRAPNFMNYSYRDDMIMDAVENCIKAVGNFDPDKPTRTGKPNPFSYFTQISYFAFLRRITKEKKQADIKQNLIDNNNIDTFATFSDADSVEMGSSMIESMRYINEEFYDESLSTAEPKEEEEPPKDQKKSAKRFAPGPLSDFIS